MRRALIAGTVLVTAAVIAAVLSEVDGGDDIAASNEAPPATAQVVKTNLVQSVHVSGTLSHGEPKELPAASAEGTITWIAPEGSVVKVGQPMYKVDNVPVILLAGPLPLYRVLQNGVEGPDVLQLEKFLAANGFLKLKPNNYFGSATLEAVKDWQQATGQPKAGKVEPSDVVVAPGKSAVRIAQHSLEVGDKLGGPVLSYTGTAPQVVVELDAAKQHLVKKGLKATITLPTGKSTGGTVASVSTVATVPSEGEGDSQPTIPVVITLASPGASGGLDAAPVDVALVSAQRNGVLAVPVSALVALAEGGYGVQVVDGAKTSYVAVKTGMFADGKVEISGAGIGPGTVVGVPS